MVFNLNNELKDLTKNSSITFLESINKYKKVIILITTILFIVTGVIIFNYFYNSDNPLKDITPEVRDRLQTYEYYKDKPQLGLNEMMEKKPELTEYIISNSLKKVIALDDNQKFFTNENLIYLSWNKHYVARGVLQETNVDGVISEQDVEYEFIYGITNENATPKPQYHLIDKRELSEKKIIGG